MLAQTQKELTQLKTRQKFYQRKILKIKELLLQSGVKELDQNALELKVLKDNLSKDSNLVWEILSDFSYDLPSLLDVPQILAHLYWRFSPYLTLDYIQLTLKISSLKSSSYWHVYFLKGLDKQNFVINERQYALDKIQPCTRITFYQENNQEIHSFAAIPLFHLGENLGVLGFACKKHYEWKDLSEHFYKQLARILARRVYNLCIQEKETKMPVSFADFAREVLEPFKQEAKGRGIELDYNFTDPLLRETRPYLLSELRQWLSLLAKDVLEKKQETIVRLNFYEKEGRPLVQILSINSPCLLGEELARYLKERDNFPTIQKKSNTYSLEIAFTNSPL